jgi:hypothetical protein
MSGQNLPAGVSSSDVEQAVISQAEALELMKRLVGDGFDWRCVLTGTGLAIAEMVGAIAGPAKVAEHFEKLAAMTSHLRPKTALSSPLLEWLSEWCDTSDPQARTPSKVLFDHFRKWNEDAGREHTMTAAAFGRAMRDQQFRSIKDRTGQRQRIGIRLRQAAPH